MIKMFKKWLVGDIYDKLHNQTNNQVYDPFRDAFRPDATAIVIFRINNGFVVRAGSGLIYCADHQAIADYIMASATRDRLGVQLDMFEPLLKSAQQQQYGKVSIPQPTL
jgi:hypothetical protein